MLWEIAKNQHNCSNCGTKFPLPRIPSAFENIWLSPERYVPPDQDLYVTCPVCGKREIAVERRFFGGVAGPKTMQAVLYIFFALVFCFITAMILDGIGIIKVF